MTYASDKLYNEVIRMGGMGGRLATTVKVREIMPHLPCLTLTDREEIDAKKDNSGNYSAVIFMLDCLRRRQNWPEQLINALRVCEHWALADEISDPYDRIRGINTQKTVPAAAAVSSGPAPAATGPAAPPAASPPPPVPDPVAASAAAAPSPAQSPATTVTTATIHRAPHSTPPLLTPSPVEPPAQAAAPAPAHSPPESLPSIAAPGPAETPAPVPNQEVLAPPPPEPAQRPEPSPLVSAPQAGPPFSVSAPSVPSLSQNELSVNTAVTPSLDSPDHLTLTPISEVSSAAATSIHTNTVTTSPSLPNTPSTSFQPPAVPEESKIPVAVTESPTSVKSPIQDTNPPERVTVLAQASNTNSAANQPVETVQTMVSQNSQAQAQTPERAQVLPSASNGAVVANPSHMAAVGEEYLSKPGILMDPRAEPSLDSYDDLEISRHPTATAGSSPVQPSRPAPASSPLQPEEQSGGSCSVRSDELMFSSSITGITSSSVLQDSQHSPTENMEVPTEPVPASHPAVAADNLVPHSTPEENSFREGDTAFSHNQPVEDHYESFYQSLQAEQRTLVNIVHVSEEPSILNLNGQPPSMIGNAVRPNDNKASLNHASQAESPLLPVVSEDQPRALQSQGITERTQRNEVHASDQTGPVATSSCQKSGFNSSGLINPPRSEQREESQGVLSQLQSNPGLIVAAAAVGVAVLAWKLKH